MIKITFPDGSQKEFNKGVEVIEIAKSISISLAKKVIAAKFNDDLIEINRKLDTDGSLVLLTAKDKLALEINNKSIENK